MVAAAAAAAAADHWARVVQLLSVALLILPPLPLHDCRSSLVLAREEGVEGLGQKWCGEVAAAAAAAAAVLERPLSCLLSVQRPPARAWFLCPCYSPQKDLPAAAAAALVAVASAGSGAALAAVNRRHLYFAPLDDPGVCLMAALMCGWPVRVVVAALAVYQE